MPVNQEVSKIGDIDCYSYNFKSKEVGIKLPFVGNLPLLLTADQKDMFEQHVQAEMEEAVSEAALIQVPLLVLPNQMPHPIQVKRLPWREVDLLPRNRAIAEIGEAFTYWQSVNKILHDPESKIGFFELKLVTLHPLYVLPDSKQFVFTVPIQEDEVRLFGKNKYPSRVQFINHAADGDFCGTWRHALPSITILTIDSEQENVGYKDIGISEAMVGEVFEYARAVLEARNLELGEIIQSLNETCPVKLWTQLTPHIIKKGEMFQAYHLDQENDECHYLDRIEFDEEFRLLRQKVDNAFLEGRFSSKTVKKVEEYCQVLGKMYQEASQYYTFSP